KALASKLRSKLSATAAFVDGDLGARGLELDADVLIGVLHDEALSVSLETLGDHLHENLAGLKALHSGSPLFVGVDFDIKGMLGHATGVHRNLLHDDTGIGQWSAFGIQDGDSDADGGHRILDVLLLLGFERGGHAKRTPGCQQGDYAERPHPTSLAFQRPS